MIENLPASISLIFILTTLVSVWLFFRAAQGSIKAVIAIIAWLIIQALIALSGFYLETNSFPPRFVLVIGPPFLLILFLFVTSKGRKLIDKLDPAKLTYLHVVRIPVEITLLYLFLYKQVPQLMTFEGRNFDILSGLSAPVVAYFGYKKMKLSKTILLIWNFICLGLLINIVINAVLSVPFPFQKFAFDQPNTAVLYFPFVWLPACIVPLVLFAHLSCIRRLVLQK